MPTLTVEAPAKLNLTLDVLGRRADGYHDLNMVMQSVALSDTITLELGTGGPLSVKSNLGFLQQRKKPGRRSRPGLPAGDWVGCGRSRYDTPQTYPCLRRHGRRLLRRRRRPPGHECSPGKRASSLGVGQAGRAGGL